MFAFLIIALLIIIAIAVGGLPVLGWIVLICVGGVIAIGAVIVGSGLSAYDRRPGKDE